MKVVVEVNLTSESLHAAETETINKHQNYGPLGLKNGLIVSPKIRDTVLIMDHARSSSMSAEIACVQPISHISFGISCIKLHK